MTTRQQIKKLPDNAIQCIGPLMLDLNHYITPDGQLFHIHPTTKKIQKISLTKHHQKWAFAGAKMLLFTGEIKDMCSINGFYEKENGRATPSALITYYFKEKIMPSGMRSINSHPDNLLHIDYLSWDTKQEQDNIRMANNRELRDPNNIYKIAENINISDYTKYKDTRYFVKNDGTDIVKEIGDNKYRQITIRLGGDKYYNATLHIDKIPTNFRINRLMGIIHLELDTNSDLVVDHKDGKPQNNRIDNLRLKTGPENTILGKSSCPIFKVNPTDMTIVDDIRCIIEYTTKNTEFISKTIRRVKNTGEIYKEFIWLDKSLEGILFTKENNKIILNSWTTNSVVDHIRSIIDKFHIENTISEEMFQLDDMGKIIYTNEIDKFIKELDPRGLGKEDLLDQMNLRINDHLSCCKIISMHADSCANAQIILCLKTMIVFTRSRDNLQLVDRKCPLCDRPSTASRFDCSDPEMCIPIYSYNTADKTNGNPLGFVKKYSNVYNGITKCDNGKYSSDKLIAIRKSLFGLAGKFSKSWDKKTNGFLKRKVFKNLYWSFHPPINNKLNETNANWLLSRRLNCTVMILLRNKILNDK